MDQEHDIEEPTKRLARLVLHDGEDQARRLVDLQPEVLFHIATVCAPADVEALGATCSFMRVVARDETVWRRLFERDHAPRLYRHRNSRTPVHVRYPPSRSCWPAEALKVCALDVGTLAHHPSPLPDDDDCVGGKRGRAVPAALAHLIAAGKTWRWVYIAHARALLSPITIGSSPLQPGPLSCVRAMTTTQQKWKGMELFVGDVVDGKRHGHGVELDLNQRDKDEDDDEAEMITGWTAGVWANDRVNGWCVYSTSVRYQTGVAVDGSWSGLSFCVLSHVRSWGRVTAEGALVDPRFALYDRGSFRHTFAPMTTTAEEEEEDKSNMVKETLWTPFYEGDFTRDLKLGRRGQATIRFHNGDVIMQQWRDDDLVGIDKLVCSPTCPDGEFAGRTLGAGAQWRVSWFDMNMDGWRDNAYCRGRGHRRGRGARVLALRGARADRVERAGARTRPQERALRPCSRGRARGPAHAHIDQTLTLCHKHQCSLSSRCTSPGLSEV